jgi:hypothetical protein
MMHHLAVQLNHPGKEKPFKIGKGYLNRSSIILREWNRDGTHYRKFLRTEGLFVSSIGEEPRTGELLFWGEWEGESEFHPLPKGSAGNGIHLPMPTGPLSIAAGLLQNTDPYVFGDAFRYAICKQKGKMTNLAIGSVILFGSSYKHGFALDTVFVVKNATPSATIIASPNMFGTRYREQTVDRITNEYSRPGNKYQLYSGQSYADSETIFSYCPCRINSIEDSRAFPRVTLPHFFGSSWGFSPYPSGIKYLALTAQSTQEIWNAVTNEVLSQGYLLGIMFKEP